VAINFFKFHKAFIEQPLVIRILIEIYIAEHLQSFVRLPTLLHGPRPTVSKKTNNTQNILI